MSLSDNYVPVKEPGDGVTTQFSGNWAVLAAAYLRVYFEDMATGVQTLVSSSNYSLVFTSAGFTVTFAVAPVNTVYVVIGRDVSVDQTNPYTTARGFQGPDIEASFDKLTAIVQDQGDAVARALVFPLGDTTSTVLPAVDQRKGLALIFDPLTGAPGVGALPSVAVSAAMIPVVQAASTSVARTLLGAAASGANNDITGLAYLSNIAGGKRAGFVNYLTNGGMDVNQRVGPYAVTTSYAYTLDRWKATAAANGIWTISQVDISTDNLDGVNKNAMRCQRTNGSSSTAQLTIQQVLESKNIPPLRGLDMTISCKIRKGAGFTPTQVIFKLLSITSADQPSVAAGTLLATITATAGAISSSGFTTFSGFTNVGGGGGGDIPANSQQLGVIVEVLGVGTAGASDYFDFTGAQLEVGSLASIFEDRPFETELRMCQRFYQKSFSYTVAPVQNSGTLAGALLLYLPTGASGVFGQTYLFPTQMRISPTMTYYNPFVANGNWRDQTNSADRVASGVISNDRGFSLNGTGGVAGSVNEIHYTADAEY